MNRLATGQPMKGHDHARRYCSFGLFKRTLAGELGARDQYFIHARMYEDWGYNKLFERINYEMEEETDHASSMIKRILMLGGTPKMTPSTLNIGTDVPSMLQSD